MNNYDQETVTENKDKEIFTEDQITTAIKQWLDFGEKSFETEEEWLKGHGHLGYFSGGGWATRCLRYHLRQREKVEAEV